MAVTRTRSSYPSKAGHGIDVSYMVWKDDAKKPIGVIQVTHGWGEYGERYDELCTFLAENGYVVAAQDHLGHGRTTGHKALGIYPKHAAKYMIEDMHTLYEIMHKEYKKLPYMLYGHSMGSMMTRIYLSKWGDELDAAVVCGTIYSAWPEAFLVPVVNLLTPIIAKPYEKEHAKYEKKNADKSDAFGTHKPNLIEKMTNSWLSYDQDNIYNYVNAAGVSSAWKSRCCPQGPERPSGLHHLRQTGYGRFLGVRAEEPGKTVQEEKAQCDAEDLRPRQA